jgi:hypothetical protein
LWCLGPMASAPCPKHPFANVEILKMHKDPIVWRKEPNEIEIARSAGEKLTI